MYERDNLTIQILTRAREMVAQGWIQGTGKTTSFHGRILRCAQQAIFDVIDECHLDAGRQSEQFHDAQNAVLCHARGHWNSIPAWNDEPGRTQPEVLAAFDAAIASLKPDPPIRRVVLPVQATFGDKVKELVGV